MERCGEQGESNKKKPIGSTSGSASKPATRNFNKKPRTTSVTSPDCGSSPALNQGRKRRGSAGTLQGEPSSKRMAEGQILEAISGINKTMVTMQDQLKSVPTKTELGALVSEMRGVKEMVIRNTDRIDSLFDLSLIHI